MYQNLVCSVHGYKAAGSGMAVQFTMLVFMEFSVLICYRQNLENIWRTIYKVLLRITTTQIQISRQNLNGIFSNISHQMMI